MGVRVMREPFAVRGMRRLVRMFLTYELRNAYGEALLEAFIDLQEEARARGRWAVARLFLVESLGVARTAIVERKRKGWKRMGHSDKDARLGQVGGSSFGDGIREVKHAIRVLRKRPGYALAVILTLALGISTAAAAFTVVNGTLLRPLPYEDDEEIVLIWSTHLDEGGETTTVSPADFLAWRESTVSFEGVVAHNLWFPVVSGGEGDAGRPMAGLVTPGFFDLFGVQPMLGRTFRPEESEGDARVTILSYGVWRSRFAADPTILGQSVRLNGESYEIVGVLPADYRHPDPHRPLVETALFAPFDMTTWPSQTGRYLRVFGRLGPGVSVEQAQSEMVAISLDLEVVRPVRNNRVSASVITLRDQTYGSIRWALFMVLTGAGVLFLIAGANVTNLVLARSLARKREFAVRIAMGAGSRTIAKQLLLENGLLALFGAGVGLVAVAAGMTFISSFQGVFIPTVADLQLDLTVSLVAAGLAVVVTLVLGSLPLLEILGTPVRAVLGEESAGGGGSRRGQRLRAWLVIGEVGLAAALVVGAGLLGNSFRRLSVVSPGFDQTGTLTAEVTLPRDRYPDHLAVTTAYEEMRQQISAIPGVRTVGFASELPMLDGNWSNVFDVVDQPQVPERQPTFEIRYVSPGYFESMGIDVVAGRAFRVDDRDDALPVVIVNEDLAARYWEPGGAVGKRLQRTRDGEILEMEIVGVVGDVLDDGLSGAPEPFVYFPFSQRSNRGAAFVIRSDGNAASLGPPVRSTIRNMDSEVPIGILDLYENRIADSIAGPQFAAVLAMLFSLVALLLAGLGIYGVLAYAVGARTREIGIRSALGAHQRDLAAMVVRQSLSLVAIGVVMGLGVSVLENQLLKSFMFGASTSDLATFLLAPAVLVVVALVASYVPVRRALRVEPVEALRGE